MLDGKEGYAVRKSMQILVALGEIFGAKNLIDVGSVQVAGVSYHNLGDAGLEFLNSLAADGKVKVLTTLNPAGMDLENWQQLGISPDFADKQNQVIDAFERMGILISCTCTPYLIGNLPLFGEHVAWSESSAVTFANSVLGARTNREGGPSALAAAFVGKTPCYGLHLDENRVPDIHVQVNTPMTKLSDWGALGYAIGKKAENKILLHYRNQKRQPRRTQKLRRLAGDVWGEAAFLHERRNPQLGSPTAAYRNSYNRTKRHQSSLRPHKRRRIRNRLCLRWLPSLQHQRDSGNR